MRNVEFGVTNTRREDPSDVTSNSDSSVPSRLCDVEEAGGGLSTVVVPADGYDEERKGPRRLRCPDPVLKRGVCFPRKKRLRRNPSGDSCDHARSSPDFSGTSE